MAQSVVINGVTYNSVPYVEIPKSTSGTAQFVDTSDATLNSSSQLLSGVTAYAGTTKYTGSVTLPTISQDSVSYVLSIS